MRDDYAVLHYGFLPAMEKPPRLLQVGAGCQAMQLSASFANEALALLPS